ncbi:MAG: hypothetical protein K1X86_15865 [Ignavibacteria bacterium]|nr:hypothetical protein [Ignavibacteria bacterium]
MAGIAAGVKDKEKNYGDILVATFTWNYDSGKYKFDTKISKTVFEADPEQIEIDATMVHLINELKSDKKMLEKVENNFTESTTDKKSNTSLKVFLGPLASGSAVLADKKKLDKLRVNYRKLIGIDMETFGVYYAVKNYCSNNRIKVISIKSISDFADQRKSDKYRKYAAYTSASFIYNFIQTKL